ncbi:MAG: ComF family protein [Clostridia bacterium]|nr:ComF family protein [Clostridia bacterium]
MGAVRKLARQILSLFYPKRCAFCGSVLKGDQAVCEKCAATLPFIRGEACPHCGRAREYCCCSGRGFGFDRCVAPLYYEGATRAGICRVKFHGKKGYITQLAELTADTVRREYAGIAFDAAVAVPMSRRELRSRGFNQSALFCRALCAELGIAFRGDLLQKPLDTRPQRSCKADQRWRNVSGVFTVRKPASVSGKTILLVDDIITTGATLNECAQVLKKAGAAHVCCAVIAAVRQKNARAVASAIN